MGKSLAPLQAVGSTVDCPIYKAVFTDISSLFPGPSFTIVIIPAQVGGSFDLSPIDCHARSPV